MADLHNLLGELNEDEPVFPEDTAESVEHGEPSDHDDDIRERPEVPPALAEAERDQFRPIQDEPADLNDFDLDAKRDKVLADGDEEEDVDYVQLKRLWTTELNCPELFPYDAETVGLQMELLQGQEESIDKLLLHASTARGRDSSSKTDPNLASLVASIYKMDADRVRFMLTDLTRARLAKIEQHALYMRGMVDRMSEDEVSYLKQYGELYERHFRRTVLDHLPKDAWKNLDEPEMIDSPDLDEFVFCKVMETVEIDNRDQEGEENLDQLAGDTIQEHQAGACLIARYSAIKDLVMDGKIELIM